MNGLLGSDVKRRRRLVAALCGGLVAIAAGCSNEASDSASSKPATGSSESAPGAPSDGSPGSSDTPEEQAVIEAYKNFFTLGLTTGGLGNDEIRELLGPFATTEIVNRMQLVVANQAAIGRKPGGAPTFGDPQAIVSGATATVSDCRDGSTEVVVDAQTGEVLVVGNPNTKYDVALVLGDDGRWRVSEFDTLDDGCTR